MIEKVKRIIKDSPLIKTVIFFTSVFLSGILASGFVSEITESGKLKWINFYKTTSFYLIIIYLLILYMYNRFLFISETEQKKFLEKDYVQSYIVSECLPELAERYKRDLKDGKSQNELIDIQKEIKKLTK
jgi:hypothetical protein